jgi:hypothetical protein
MPWLPDGVEHPLRSGAIGDVDRDRDSTIHAGNRSWDDATELLRDEARVRREVIGTREDDAAGRRQP